ncbi:GyrI-like domain-containing protein [Haloferax namakaokahaiae]|uniref:GyrI-like domain-containing protein n=1 Tax=Haloferax namakaokahaiae TaxID=1748331 RepID=A0ABD5ZC46_9EURY
MATRAMNPEIETREGFTVVGIPHRASPQSDFAAIWDEFGQRVHEYDGSPIEEAAYAVGYDYNDEIDEFTYLTGMRTDPDPEVPDGWEAIDVPPQTYAVFTTTMAEAGEAMVQIYQEWLPVSEYSRGMGPEFEYYDEAFDATDPDSTFTVHVPITSAK